MPRWHNVFAGQASVAVQSGRMTRAADDAPVTSTVISLRQPAVEPSFRQAAFDQLPVAALWLNAGGQVLVANAAAHRLFCAGELPGRHLAAFLGFAAARHVDRRWARLWTRLQRAASGAALHVMAQVPLADGRRLVLALDATLLRVGSVSVAALVLRDVSAERDRARSRAAQQARLQAVIGAAEGLALLIGADRRVTAVYGFSALPQDLTLADVLGVPFDLLLDEPSSAEFIEALRQSEAGELPRSTHLWRLRPRERQGPARWLAVTLLDRRRHPSIRALVLHVCDANALRPAQEPFARLERRAQVFADCSADVLMLVDTGGVVRDQSPAINRTLDLAPGQSLGRPAAELWLAADHGRWVTTVQAAAADTSPRAHHCLVRAPARGVTLRLWLAVQNYTNEPAIGGLLVSGRDITQALQDAAAATATHERRLAFRDRLLELAMQTRGPLPQVLAGVLRTVGQALQAASASFWRVAGSARTLQCEAWYDVGSDRFSRDWVGVEQAVGDQADLLQVLARHPVYAEDTAAPALARRFGDDGRWAGARAALELPVMLGGDVDGVLVVLHGTPRRWDDDEIDFASTASRMVALAIEAAQRHEADGRIEQLAWYDSLTGLPNRNLLRETMRDMIMSSSNRRRRIAVMLIDLDRFKDVNDTLGHVVGDALIKSAAQVVNETVGGGGIVARLGGDEFVVLLNAFEHRQEVALVAARMVESLHRTDLVPKIDTQASASIGVALFPEHGRDMSTLLKNADAAMYRAKRDGGNRFSFFNPIRHERAVREAQLGIQLLKAVHTGSVQFVVEYQPQVAMSNGKVVGLEALIRWQHPTFGLLTPDRFIGVAEVSGLSERITRWVVDEVCGQIARWRSVLPTFDIPVAVNVAGREMGDSALPTLVRACLAKHGIEARMLILEITERTLVRENEINNDVMTELATLGVGVVLDDFGTGYSMLGYLKRMPIVALKIDQSFIKGVPSDPDSCAIVHAMLAVARHFRLKVVAEGIENVEQAQYLRSVGCECAQGYYYARPLPAQAIVERVAGEVQVS